MALYKRDNVWWMRFTYKGKQVRKSTDVTDRRMAEKIYHKVMTQLAEGKWFETQPGDTKTLSELLTTYMEVHSSVSKSPESYVRDKNCTDHLLRLLGNPFLKDITSSLVSQFKVKRRQEGAAPATLNKELQMLGHAFKFAINEWEWLSENPVKKVSKEKDHTLIERWLTAEEENRLLAVCPKLLREIIVFAIYTGLRRGEILNLQWHQVDLFRKTITFIGREQKNRSRDTLPLNQKALSILIERSKLRSIKTPLVFYNGNGNKISGRNLARDFEKAYKRAGIDHVRFHDLRHTFATRLIQAGVDIYTVQKLGRWKSISMVMRYAHHQPESLRSGVEVLDKDCAKISTILAQSPSLGEATHG